MNDNARAGATAVMWIVYGVIVLGGLGVATTPGFEGWIFAVVVLFVTVLAALGTRAIWYPPPSRARSVQQDTAARKAKRVDADRLSRLLDRLDEDEIVELETLLSERGQDRGF